MVNRLRRSRRRLVIMDQESRRRLEGQSCRRSAPAREAVRRIATWLASERKWKKADWRGRVGPEADLWRWVPETPSSKVLIQGSGCSWPMRLCHLLELSQSAWHLSIDLKGCCFGARVNAVSAFWQRLRNGLLRQFLGREVWALTDQSVVSATNFLTNVMLARFMGLREFGIFVLAWMSVLFVNSLQTALIVAPMMSIGPKQEVKDRPSYFGAVVFQEFVLVTLCFVLVFVAVKTSSRIFPHADLRHLALPLAVSAFAYQMQSSCGAISSRPGIAAAHSPMTISAT